MVEHQLPKLSVEGSIPFARSNTWPHFGVWVLQPVLQVAFPQRLALPQYSLRTGEHRAAQGASQAQGLGVRLRAIDDRQCKHTAQLGRNHGATAALLPYRHQRGESTMANFGLLHYAIVFLVVALAAAAVGFGGVAGVAMEGARLLFWVFIVLFVVSLLASLIRRT